MRVGIVGTEGAGKTTVFQALTRSKGTIPTAHNIASVNIPDSRIDFLSDVFKPKKTTYAKIEFSDPPGFSRKSLALLQPVEALVYVIPVFGKFDNPARLMQNLGTELILRDSEICDNAIKKVQNPKEKELLEKCSYALLDGTPLREVELNEEETKLLKGFGFLTLKPAVIIFNIGQAGMSTDSMGEELDKVRAGFKTTPTIELNAKIESEIAELNEEERKEYEAEFGIGEPPLNRFVRIALPLLKVISFFTVVGDEVRAWQITQGTQVIKAAGKVHSDMERGFIRAEVIGIEEFKLAGSFKAAKDKGLLRTVKQDYIVKDGDIIEFKFH